MAAAYLRISPYIWFDARTMQFGSIDCKHSRKAIDHYQAADTATVDTACAQSLSSTSSEPTRL